MKILHLHDIHREIERDWENDLLKSASLITPSSVTKMLPPCGSTVKKARLNCLSLRLFQQRPIAPSHP